MVRLSVNINKFATLRNARGGNNPDILEAARHAEMFGAQGITVHPRPDARHIRYQDVLNLKKEVTTELNIEGYPDESFLQLIQEVRPEQVTLVPDSPEVLTSHQGWDTLRHADFLNSVIHRIRAWECRVSLFVGTDLDLIKGASLVGADRIELYTGPYAEAYLNDREKAILPYMRAAEQAQEWGLGINAGHDLDLNNLSYFAQNVPGLAEVSIGHALICDALYHGLRHTIQMYRDALA